MNRETRANLPPFIAGLQTARKVLTTLREKKVKELQVTSLRSEHQHPTEEIESKPPQQLIQSLEAQEMITEPPEKSKKEDLCEKINTIGEGLHDCYQQNEAYELIFAKLCDYYSSNLKTMQENQRLKRKGYQLDEDITSYKTKIQQNYGKIEQHQTHTAHIRILAQEQLQSYLKDEKEKAEIQPLPVLSAAKIDFKTENSAAPKEDNRDEPKLTLNWRSLAQMSKKPQVRKSRPKMSQQQQLRTSFPSSQLYNL